MIEIRIKKKGKKVYIATIYQLDFHTPGISLILTSLVKRWREILYLEHKANCFEYEHWWPQEVWFKESLEEVLELFAKKEDSFNREIIKLSFSKWNK